jgi:hypothetical protein
MPTLQNKLHDRVVKTPFAAQQLQLKTEPQRMSLWPI